MPMPPNEACVIPPLMKTMRRETMYVPIIPQVMAANSDAQKAFTKKSYLNRSMIVLMVVLVVVVVLSVKAEYRMRNFAVCDNLQRAIVRGQLLGIV